MKRVNVTLLVLASASLIATTGCANKTQTGAAIGAGIITIGTELLAPMQEGFTIFGISIPPVFGFVNVLMALLLIVIMIYKPRGIMNGRELWDVGGFRKTKGGTGK